MARITPYVANNVHIGQELAVKIKKVVWMAVGRGTVAAYSDYEVNITGNIGVPGYRGALNIHLQLKDDDSQALSGPCCLRLNSHTDEDAKYRATRDQLTVFAVLGGKKQNVTITPTNKGTQTECKLFGHIDETVHLDPT
ncbi:MAG: hypothetical protein ACK2U5_24585 [Candidatus Promineifilaceae bacterium]|jgi:CTP-dependent riboflavin kinase